jgi:hypothetical protein
MMATSSDQTNVESEGHEGQQGGNSTSNMDHQENHTNNDCHTNLPNGEYYPTQNQNGDHQVYLANQWDQNQAYPHHIHMPNFPSYSYVPYPPGFYHGYPMHQVTVPHYYVPVNPHLPQPISQRIVSNSSTSSGGEFSISDGSGTFQHPLSDRRHRRRRRTRGRRRRKANLGKQIVVDLGKTDFQSESGSTQKTEWMNDEVTLESSNTLRQFDP